jgi:PBP4 family serine-type D-alanyl-D-alanine carboxypeptidase
VRVLRLGLLCWLALVLAFLPSHVLADDAGLAAKAQTLMERPAFRHSTFGLMYYDLDAHKPIYTFNADRFLAPASTTKLVTEGTLLALLGPDFRFHTRVYTSGPVGSDGVLNGDLILVGSGDPNLSNRVRPDGTLAFANEDHAYNGDAVPGDPLVVIRELAVSVAKTVKTVNGGVLVDASLFPEGEHESGTGTTVSPIVINDNVVDVTIAPGATAGAAARMTVSPATGYVTFVNDVKTSAPGAQADMNFVADKAAADGTHTVTIAGSIPIGSKPALNAYAIPAPSVFARIALTEALTAAGVTVHTPKSAPEPDSAQDLRSMYAAGNMIAEHISPPLSEEVKVTLKVSQNLHAHLAMYNLGIYKAHATTDVEQAGFDAERRYLVGAGVDPDSAAIADGEGTAYLTPHFVVSYLAYMWKQPNFPIFERALPILGVDGTLWNIQSRSPAAGHVHAKTGTDEQADLLNRHVLVYAKGLAGYVTTRHGRHIAFAVYVNNVDVKDEDAVTSIPGQAMGELAALAYQL